MDKLKHASILRDIMCTSDYDDANDDASFLAFKTEFFFVFFLFAYATSFFSFVSIGIAILVAHELNRIFFLLLS